MTDRVIIFDTTLRDGEQALKASLTVKEKLQIALALERLGVDVMEVGFPVSSQGDFEFDIVLCIVWNLCEIKLAAVESVANIRYYNRSVCSNALYVFDDLWTLRHRKTKE